MSTLLTITVLDLLNLAYSDIGETGSGQTLSATLETMGMNTFNVVVDGLGAMRNTCYSQKRTLFPLQAGAYQYLIGPSASAEAGAGYNFGGYNNGGYNGNPSLLGFDTDRPITIDNWAVMLGGFNPPLELTHRRTISSDKYDLLITMKTLTSTFPTALFYNPRSPNGVLNFWPVPQSGGNAAVLYYPEAMNQAVQLTQKLMLPPGYAEMLEYLTAEALAPKCGRDVPDVIMKNAAKARSFVKSRNLYVPELEVPFSRQAGYYNWLTDQTT